MLYSITLKGNLLAPFLFIIMMDYVYKRSAGVFGYLTHKRNTHDNSGKTVRSTTREFDLKVNDLTLADDISQLETTQPKLISSKMHYNLTLEKLVFR